MLYSKQNNAQNFLEKYNTSSQKIDVMKYIEKQFCLDPMTLEIQDILHYIFPIPDIPNMIIIHAVILLGKKYSEMIHFCYHNLPLPPNLPKNVVLTNVAKL